MIKLFFKLMNILKEALYRYEIFCIICMYKASSSVSMIVILLSSVLHLTWIGSFT